MNCSEPWRRLLASVAMALALTPCLAADLADIRARGEIRHLGIHYANFVTGAGDGFDVELVQGFARRLGVRYRLVPTDFYNVIRDLLGKDVVRQGDEVTLRGDYPVQGDLIATGFTMLPWREKVLLYWAPTFRAAGRCRPPASRSIRRLHCGLERLPPRTRRRRGRLHRRQRTGTFGCALRRRASCAGRISKLVFIRWPI
jgi:hypothetical protein